MMKEKWYAMPPEDVLARLGSDASVGLPGKAARARLRAEGENEIFSLPRSSAFRHATYILSDVSVLLLILAAVIGALFNRSGVSLSAVVVLALSCAASVVVYVYARRTAERMAVCTMPRARVIRGGKLYAIDVRELVRGDVILLETGDIVPADARLLSADSLEVMEYTGKISGKAERERSVKDAAATYPAEGIRRISEQKNMVFAGSLVLTGSARAVVTEIGSNCFIVSTEGQIPLLSQRDRLPALSSVEKVCGRVAVLALLLILPLILLGVFCTDSLGLMDSFLLAVSFAVSSMGELTAAWGHFIVGRGVRAAARNGENAAVMPHAADISAIASADTVVLFGETALNSGKRSVKAAWRGLSRVSFDSSAKNAGGNEPWACALISAGLPSASSLQRGGGGDRTIDALLSTAANLGVTSDRLRQSVRLIDFAPASPANPFSMALIEENKSLHAVCAGELRQLLPRCTRVADASAPGGIGLMRADRSQPLLAAVDAELADGGFAVAYARRSSPCAHLRRISMLQQELTLIGVVIYADPIGEGIRGAADALAERGVRSVLMADAAAEKEGIVASARAAGILRDGVIARAPEPIPTDAELCLGYDAAARQAFLRGLAERGHSVIGVGTEVADLISLRACSIAAACTPIHLASEQPVSILSADAYYGSGLLNKNAGLLVRRAEGQGGGLCGIAAACSAAGRILRNLRVAIHYLLASQTVRVSTLVLSLCLGISGILPIHLLVCGLVVDFAAALALAFSREDCRADREVCFRHPFRGSAGWIFIGLVCGLAAALTTALLQIGGVLTQDMTGGFLFLSMVLGQAALLPLCFHASGNGKLSLPIWLYAAGGMLFGLICLLLPAVGSLFAVVSMPLPAMLCLLIAPVVVLFGGEILHTVSLMYLSRENDDAKT